MCHEKRCFPTTRPQHPIEAPALSRRQMCKLQLKKNIPESSNHMSTVDQNGICK